MKANNSCLYTCWECQKEIPLSETPMLKAACLPICRACQLPKPNEEKLPRYNHINKIQERVAMIRLNLVGLSTDLMSIGLESESTFSRVQMEKLCPVLDGFAKKARSLREGRFQRLVPDEEE